MNQANLSRLKSNEKQTLGKMTLWRNGQSMTVDTLELGWHDNKRNISCVPEGAYLCRMMPFKNTFRYQLLKVPFRDGIFIHTGNDYMDILGCILVGTKPADINGDGQIDVTSSGPTLTALEAFMNREDFLLTII
jgi:hypothetical protein